MTNEVKWIDRPTEKMCDAARGFILSLQCGINTYEEMRESLTRRGDKIPDWMTGTGHLTKWDIAECIYLFMECERIKETTNEKGEI